MRQASPGGSAGDFASYVEECRSLVLEEIRAIAPHSRRSPFEAPADDAPLRGPTLRPALCVAGCRGLGGPLEGVLRTAAALELDPALALQPLLDNVELLGLGRALRILRLVARSARESAEGRRTELEWARRAHSTPSDRDYVRMVYQRSVFADFLAPLLSGAIAAGADPSALASLARFATPLGVAFQIRDELRALGDGGEDAGGRRGRHSLALVHALRARRAFEALARILAPSTHRAFLAALVDLAVEADR